MSLLRPDVINSTKCKPTGKVRRCSIYSMICTVLERERGIPYILPLTHHFLPCRVSCVHPRLSRDSSRCPHSPVRPPRCSSTLASSSTRASSTSTSPWNCADLYCSKAVNNSWRSGSKRTSLNAVRSLEILSSLLTLHWLCLCISVLMYPTR